MSNRGGLAPDSIMTEREGKGWGEGEFAGDTVLPDQQTQEEEEIERRWYGRALDTPNGRSLKNTGDIYYSEPGVQRKGLSGRQKFRH